MTKRRSDQICSEINVVTDKAKQYKQKCHDFWDTRKALVTELKGSYPDIWLAELKERCKIGRRQAFKIAAIADGRTTLEKERERDAAAHRVHDHAPGNTENTDETRAADEAAMGIVGRPRGLPSDGDEMPTEAEAEESYQETIFDQACLLLDEMADETRQRFFAKMKETYHPHASTPAQNKSGRTRSAAEPCRTTIR
jgi:hypothetical protein